MKAESHRLLGEYLMEKYMPGLSPRNARAFLMGCIEPDRNPATYLKGSLRSQWLRGHNWGNAQRYMARLSLRLERKEQLHIWDYYCMGKLIHYIADAFTYAHNDHFQSNLRSHCGYERVLQGYFRQYLAGGQAAVPNWYGSVMEAVRAYHQDYVRRPAGPYTDARYTVTVCSTVLSVLFLKQPCPAF